MLVGNHLYQRRLLLDLPQLRKDLNLNFQMLLVIPVVLDTQQVAGLAE